MTMNSLFRISILAWALFVSDACHGRSLIALDNALAVPCGSTNTQEQSTQDSAFANICNMLTEADALFRSGKKSEAVQLGEKVLKLVRKHYGDNSKEMAFQLSHVATYYNGYDTKKALEYGQKALLTMENIGDAQEEDFFFLYSGLGTSYHLLSDSENAIIYTLKALDCAKIAFGEQSEAYIETLLQMGMYTNAENKDRYVEEAVKLAKQVYGDNSLQYADVLYMSTLLDYKTGKQTINKLIECCNILENNNT